jgi:hypothetical protein
MKTMKLGLRKAAAMIAAFALSLTCLGAGASMFVRGNRSASADVTMTAAYSYYESDTLAEGFMSMSELVENNVYNIQSLPADSGFAFYIPFDQYGNAIFTFSDCWGKSWEFNTMFQGYRTYTLTNYNDYCYPYGATVNLPFSERQGGPARETNYVYMSLAAINDMFDSLIGFVNNDNMPIVIVGISQMTSNSPSAAVFYTEDFDAALAVGGGGDPIEAYYPVTLDNGFTVGYDKFLNSYGSGWSLIEMRDKAVGVGGGFALYRPYYYAVQYGSKLKFTVNAYYDDEDLIFAFFSSISDNMWYIARFEDGAIIFREAFLPMPEGLNVYFSYDYLRQFIYYYTSIDIGDSATFDSPYPVEEMLYTADYAAQMGLAVESEGEGEIDPESPDYIAGYEGGYEIGYSDGHIVGYEEGYEVGYEEGYIEGLAEIDGEPGEGDDEDTEPGEGEPENPAEIGENPEPEPTEPAGPSWGEQAWLEFGWHMYNNWRWYLLGGCGLLVVILFTVVACKRR